MPAAEEGHSNQSDEPRRFQLRTDNILLRTIFALFCGYIAINNPAACADMAYEICQVLVASPATTIGWLTLISVPAFLLQVFSYPHKWNWNIVQNDAFRFGSDIVGAVAGLIVGSALAHTLIPGAAHHAMSTMAHNSASFSFLNNPNLWCKLICLTSGLGGLMGSDYIIGKLRTPLTRIDNNRESQSASKDWTRTSNYLVRYVKFFFCLFLATNANACVDSAYRICLALVESSALELSVVVGVTAVVSGVRGLLYPGFMQDLVRLDFPKANIKDLGLDIARGVQDMLVATSALRLYNAMSPLHTEHNHNHNHEAEHKNSCAALCLAAVGVGIAGAHLTVKYATKLAQPQAAPDDLESSPRPSAFPSAASTVPACCTGLQK